MKKIHWLTISLSIVSLSIIFYACNKDDRSRPATDQKVTLQEAKMIYSYAGQELESRFGNRYSTIRPRWEGARSESFGLTHNVMYVRLGFDDSNGGLLQLIIMKDEGRLRSMLVEIQPDADWRKDHYSLDDYGSLTGSLIFYSVNGRFRQAYVMKNGSKVSGFTPEHELKNPSTLMNLNQGSISGRTEGVESAACVDGTFGCQELAEVLVVARPHNQSNYVYIYIPSTIYNSNPSGGTFNGYNWYPNTGGGPNPQVPPGQQYLPLQSRWRLCGTYNWKKIGSSQYAMFTNLGFSLVNTNGQILTFMWYGPCIQFGSSVASQTAANEAWNETWNQALAKVQMDANSSSPVIGDFQVKQNMKNYIQNYLAQNFSGSTFNPTGCSGAIPYSEPKYCD